MRLQRARGVRERCRLLGRNDEGTLLVLMIFYGFLSLVLVLLVVAATSLYLERKRLFTLADGAALIGAEAFELGDVAVTTDGPRARLQSKEVTAAVRNYLFGAETGIETGVDGAGVNSGADTAAFESLELESAESTDGRSATVRLSSYWRPPVLSLFVPDGIRLDVTAVARSIFS